MSLIESDLCTKEVAVVNKTRFRLLVSVKAEKEYQTHVKVSNSSMGHVSNKNNQYWNKSRSTNNFSDQGFIQDRNNKVDVELGAGATTMVNGALGLANEIAGNVSANIFGWGGGGIGGSSKVDKNMSGSAQGSGNGMINFDYQRENRDIRSNLKHNINNTNDINSNINENEEKFSKNSFMEQKREIDKIETNGTAIPPNHAMPFSIAVKNQRSLVHFTIYQMIEIESSEMGAELETECEGDINTTNGINYYNVRKNKNSNKNRKQCVKKYVPIMLCQNYGINHKFLVLTESENDKNLVEMSPMNEYDGYHNKRKNKNNECYEMLEMLNLQRFYDNFVRDGWTSVDTWNDMTNDDIQHVGLNRGHKVKFLKFLKDRKQQQEIFNSEQFCSSRAPVRSKSYLSCVCGLPLRKCQIQYVDLRGKQKLFCGLCGKQLTLKNKTDIVWHCSDKQSKSFCNHEFGFTACDACVQEQKRV